MKIVKKQKNSKMCMICGLENPFGVQARFYELDDDSVYGKFTFKKEHQSYPNRVHGGMICAMLDELGFRAFWIKNSTQYSVTMDLKTKYRRPVPYDVELKGIGKVVKSSSRYFIAESKILTKENVVLAEGEIKYLFLPTKDITDTNFEEEIIDEPFIERVSL